MSLLRSLAAAIRTSKLSFDRLANLAGRSQAAGQRCAAFAHRLTASLHGLPHDA